jgi:hypothetical protein
VPIESATARNAEAVREDIDADDEAKDDVAVEVELRDANDDDAGR